MESIEKVFKAFANRRRLAIIKFLMQTREASVGEIAGAIDLSFKATSKHLTILHRADILEREQRSLLMFYRLTENPTPLIGGVLKLL